MDWTFWLLTCLALLAAGCGILLLCSIFCDDIGGFGDWDDED